MSHYNLRAKKNSPIYTDLPAHQKLSGKTSEYNPYENIGLVKEYVEKANNRYKNQELYVSIIDFIHTHKDFFPNINFIIENVNKFEVLLNYTEITYPQKMLLDARIFAIFPDYIKVKNCLEYDSITSEKDYIQKIKHIQCATDYILLYMKFNEACIDKREKTYNILRQCYDTTRTLTIEFREYKQREYDRQKVALLHSTKLPTDVCNYIIKEFL